MIEHLLSHDEVYQNVVLKYSVANKIPKNSGEKIIGFGNFDGFYLYWIQNNEQGFIFSSRIKFNKDLRNNRLSYRLHKENLSLIESAIQTIHQAYLKMDTKIIVDVPKIRTIIQEDDKIVKLTKLVDELNRKIDDMSQLIKRIDEKVAVLSNQTIDYQPTKKIMTFPPEKYTPQDNNERKTNLVQQHDKTKFYGHRYKGLSPDVDTRGKIKCSFCNNVFLDTLDECPFCKASITEIFEKTKNQ